MTESDEQLVAAWRQAGDRAALEALATRHLATVRRMIHSMTLDDGERLWLPAHETASGFVDVLFLPHVR